MYNVRRICAWVVMICVLLGCTSITWAEGERELIRFNNEETITGTRNLSGSGFSVSTGEGGFYEAPDTMSAQWTQAKAGEHYEIKLTEQAEDWSDYNYLSIRAYSPEASGAIFQLILFQGSGVYGAGNTYSHIDLVVDWSGWKTVYLPLSDLQGKLNLSGVNGIAFTNGGWGSAYMIGATICMSRISLTKEQQDDPIIEPEPDTDKDSELGLLTVADFAAAADVAKGSNLTVDTEITRLHDVSACWADTSSAVQINLPEDKRDLSQYNYFNLWAYSHKATGAAVNVVLVENGRWSYFRTTFNVDWTGWKLISLPFPPSIDSDSTDITNIGYISFDSGGWGVPSSPETKLNFDKIWLSREAVNPPVSVGVFPAASDDKMTAGDTVAVIEYNNYLSAPIAEDVVMVTEDGQRLENFTVSAYRNQLRVAF